MDSLHSIELSRALFEEAGDALFLFDPDTEQLLDVNATTERLTGVSRQELLSKPATYWVSFGPQGNRQRLRQAADRTEAFHSQEGYFLRTGQDGVWIPVNLTIARLHVQPKTLALITARDIRERHEDHARLKKAEAQLRQVLASVSDCLWSAEVDPGRRTYRYLSPAIDKITGRLAHFFLANPGRWREIMHPEDRPRWEETAGRLRLGETVQEEYRIVRPDGGVRWVRDRLSVSAGTGQVAFRLDGILTDITERMRAEEDRGRLLALEQTARAEAEAAAAALRASEEQYRSLAEAIPQIVWTARPDGWINYYNRRWFEYTGLTLEQSQGWGWTPVIHPDDLQKCADLWTECLRTGALFEAECRFKRAADGVYRWHLGRALPVRGCAGQIVKWFGSCTDIDDQKRAAEAWQKAMEEAEAASRAKSEFLANMSHEIRTPMNGVLGMTDLALATDMTREQREYLNMVKGSAEALLAVINDILDFSKIEARKMYLESADFGLRDSLGDTLRALALRAQEKGLELACHIGPEVPDALVGDPVRLRQIVINLVGNAIKFTERGEVVLDCRLQNADCRLEEKEPASSANLQSAFCNLQFSVRDTGIGIPADKQQAVFEAFTQGDPSTTRKFGGTGLGLAISSQLVQLMGGRIWLESQPGQGSTFHFTVRLGLSQNPQPRPMSAGPAALQGLPVLVVDDNATNRRILEELCIGWRMKPRVVAGGHEALAALREGRAAGEPFPLVLLDAHMPEMDGFSLAEQVRQDPELASITILMLTSAGQPEDIARCRELEIEAYLMKPVKQSELLETILAALGPGVRSQEPGVRSQESGAREDGQAASSGIPGSWPLTSKSLRILLAEDHAINQKLAVHLLEKRGHTVVVAGNGRLALAALEREPFDLVLMDVQMPELDGLEATALIRQKERGTGRHIPIIAMTAHAMKGDRERCLDAGMDGYVSKPIQGDELFQAIRTCVGRGASVQRAEEPPARQEKDFDQAELMQRVGGDRQLLQQLVAMFAVEGPRMMAAVRDALAGADALKLRRAAHTLKGAVSTLGGTAAAEAANQLETLARAGDLSRAGEAQAALEKAIARFRAALARMEDAGAEGAR